MQQKAKLPDQVRTVAGIRHFSHRASAKGTVLILRQMGDRDHVCALRNFPTGGDFVDGMNNVRAVVAVSAHITNAHDHILQNDKAIFMLERFVGDFLWPNRSFAYSH
jgi:hypothetical protein